MSEDRYNPRRALFTMRRLAVFSSRTASSCVRTARTTTFSFRRGAVSFARATDPTTDFHVDSCSELSTIEDDAFDMDVANYVLMDTPDLEGTIVAFHRVLKPGGVAVLVFSHPCFPAGRATVPGNRSGATYVWGFPYFQRQKCIDPPWAHFTSEFTWFHRPLSDSAPPALAAGGSWRRCVRRSSM